MPLLVNIYNQRDVEMIQEVAIQIPEFSAKKHLDAHIKERKEKLDDLAKRIKSDTLAVELDVQIGVPYEALLEEIARKKPDLLVMGVKGRSNLLFLSFTHRLMKCLACQVRQWLWQCFFSLPWLKRKSPITYHHR